MKKQGGVILLASAMMSLSASAETSTSSAQQLTSDILNKMTSTAVVIIGGSALDNPASLRAPDDGVMTLDTVLGAGYKVTPEITAGVFGEVVLQPFLKRDYTFSDPAVKVSHSKLITSGTFSLAADLRVYPGLLDSTRNKDQYFAWRTTQNMNYEIPGTRLTVGSVSYMRQYVMGPQGAAAGASEKPSTDFLGYWGPNVNYQLTPKFALVALYEIYPIHKLGNGFGLASISQGYPMDFEPGVSIDVTDKLNVSPFFNIYPTDAKLANTTINVTVVAKLF
ncbi:hypothetical protein WDW86_07045 [Bdellovibrionota bacterium FG-2]